MSICPFDVREPTTFIRFSENQGPRRTRKNWAGSVGWRGGWLVVGRLPGV